MELKNKRILIVEDNEMMRDTISEFISDSGAIVSDSENGTNALEKIEACSFDAVISDIRMPGGDGITLAEEIAKLPVRPLIFICSGHIDLDSEDCIRLNISAVFEKPFDFNFLVKTISAKLAHGQ